MGPLTEGDIDKVLVCGQTGNTEGALRRKKSCHEAGPFKKGTQVVVAQRSHVDREEQKGTRAHLHTLSLPLISLCPKYRHKKFWLFLSFLPI